MRLTVSCAVYGNLGEKALHESQFPIRGSRSLQSETIALVFNDVLKTQNLVVSALISKADDHLPTSSNSEKK